MSVGAETIFLTDPDVVVQMLVQLQNFGGRMVGKI